MCLWAVSYTHLISEINRGTTITEDNFNDMFEVKGADDSIKPSDAVTDKESVIGKTLRYDISEGTMSVSYTHLPSPNLICFTRSPHFISPISETTLEPPFNPLLMYGLLRNRLLPFFV